MLGAVLIVTVSLSRREPRSHLGPFDTSTLSTASPATQGRAKDGEHITSQGSPSNFQILIG